jgi:membrane protein implicated in regulation of membrane protease activity
MPNEQTRAYIYRILAAAGAVAVGAGIITGDDIVLWLGLAAAVLNIMPAMNTTTKKDE